MVVRRMMKEPWGADATAGVAELRPIQARKALNWASQCVCTGLWGWIELQQSPAAGLSGTTPTCAYG